MTKIQQDDILLKAAIEFGPDYFYEIKGGSLGLTLYIHVPGPEESKHVRGAVPMEYERLRTIVIHTTEPK